MHSSLLLTGRLAGVVSCNLNRRRYGQPKAGGDMATAQFSVRNLVTSATQVVDTSGNAVEVAIPQTSTVTEVAETPKHVPILVVFLAFIAVATAVAIAAFLIPGQPSEFPITKSVAPVEGLTIFAVFFVGAQAIERLLEPFSLLLT